MQQSDNGYLFLTLHMTNKRLGGDTPRSAPDEVRSKKNPTKRFVGPGKESERCGSVIGMWRDAQVRTYGNISFWKLLLDELFILQAWDNNDVLPNLPVDRGGNAMAVRQLQRI